MKPTEYLICHNRFINQDTFILSTTKPYYKAQVILFSDITEFMNWDGRLKNLSFAKVNDYLIVVKFAGSLDNKVEMHPTVKSQLDAQTKSMAEFYFIHEIEPQRDKFDKYKY
jgi:hypothetical protein